MAAIRRIDVYLNNIAATSPTGAEAPAVYVGIGGREFRVQAPTRQPYDAGTFTFAFGENTNVSNPTLNDPRHPQLDSDDLDHYEVYIRAEHQGTGPDHVWNLERVIVSAVVTESILNTEYLHVYDAVRLIGEANRINISRHGSQRVSLKRV